MHILVSLKHISLVIRLISYFVLFLKFSSLVPLLMSRLVQFFFLNVKQNKKNLYFSDLVNLMFSVGFKNY